jgi:hypothetical protein
MNDFYIFRKKLRLLLQRANIQKNYQISKLINL